MKGPTVSKLIQLAREVGIGILVRGGLHKGVPLLLLVAQSSALITNELAVLELLYNVTDPRVHQLNDAVISFRIGVIESSSLSAADTIPVEVILHNTRQIRKNFCIDVFILCKYTYLSIKSKNPYEIVGTFCFFVI